MTEEEIKEMIKRPFLLDDGVTTAKVRNPERYDAAWENYAKGVLPRGSLELREPEKEKC